MTFVFNYYYVVFLLIWKNSLILINLINFGLFTNKMIDFFSVIC